MFSLEQTNKRISRTFFNFTHFIPCICTLTRGWNIYLHRGFCHTCNPFTLGQIFSVTPFIKNTVCVCMCVQTGKHRQFFFILFTVYNHSIQTLSFNLYMTLSKYLYGCLSYRTWTQPAITIFYTYFTARNELTKYSLIFHWCFIFFKISISYQKLINNYSKLLMII